MEEKEKEKEGVSIDKQNTELRKQLEESEKYWNSSIEILAKRLTKPVQESVQLQAEAISMRQILTEQIKNMSYQTYKFKQKVKQFEKERLEFYLFGYQIKTNSGEKVKLIEADIASYQYRLDIFDIHVNFLRETQKDIDNINFAIKNKITLYQLTEME
jgi:hypothetical protein